MSRLKRTTTVKSLRFTARASETHTRYMSNEEVKKLARKDLTSRSLNWKPRRLA